MGNNEIYAVEANGLTKRFGEFIAVNSINLKIKKGTVYGFLGPNGAGKTTTVRMLATLLGMDEGSVKVFGLDLRTEAKKIKSKISLTGQFASVDEDLTGMENLVLVARLMGFSRIGAKVRAKELLEAFDLSDAANKQAKYYSGGMRRRLDIAASIVVTPELLFLDEPTTGLDPRSRNQVWEVIRVLTKSGTTVLLTTQYLEEADQLADRIAVIDHGKVIAEGTPSELKSAIGGGVLHVSLKSEAEYEKAATIIHELFTFEILETSKKAEISISLDNASIATQVLAQFDLAGIEVLTFSLGQPSLDEVFLSLTEGE
ncbi:hypothetical protein A5882_003663 [Enterococcus sp. 4E1_DIV0656]|uniref:ATP-binding cassette domain-containing protein n=1 Tax=Enterococcus sp. 4E1_DIV0656 TaxID=1834180 RepID=UPI000B72C942|nr:ATP-binding cassette domain-containing protein [Enterococcus sp. 4E1_DIV0656]OTO08984.1 hypothetical protein A5882_003663 [Enterococcus sp. 4E1_DIV0656]